MKSSTTTAPKKTRRMIDTRQVGIPRKTISQNQMQTSAYRLSKTAPIQGNKVVQQEMTEPFANKYFREHPEEADDIRDNEEKLKEIDEQVNSMADDMQEEEKVALLIKQKYYRTAVYGENSEEVFDSHSTLGEFYNFSDKPKSAIRHYEKAKQIEKNTNIEDQDKKTRIRVGTAEAHFSMSDESRKELTDAFKAIKPVTDVTIDDVRLRFRRDLCYARILHAKGQAENSFEQYIKAEKSLDACEMPDEEPKATYYVEFGEPGRECGRQNDAVPFYQKAYDIYKEAGNEEEAKKIYPFTKVVQEEENNEQKTEETDSKNQENVQSSQESDENDLNLQNNKSSVERISIEPGEEEENEQNQSKDQENQQNEDQEKTNLTLGATIKEKITKSVEQGSFDSNDSFDK